MIMAAKDEHLLHRILAFWMLAVILIAGCMQGTDDEGTAFPPGGRPEGGDCRSDSECSSGVCDFIKQDWGRCAPVECTTGSQADGLSDVSFFCNRSGRWQEIRGVGEGCDFDYECFRRTGKDCPTCHLEDYRYYCRNGTCAEEMLPNECELMGLKRITSKEDADASGDGSCEPTMAQRTETTVCAPCGNGLCDSEMESKCNCPEDCD